MMDFDLVAFSKEVHQNAVEHGWWEGERCDEEILALIHSEWSEALEEYRAGRPFVWHKCPYNSGMCETQKVHQGEYGCESCTPAKRKPEGIAVELIDGCIRILDYLEHKNYPIPPLELIDLALEMMTLPHKKFPYHVEKLHKYTALADEYLDNGHLIDAFCMAFRWINDRCLDPFAIMMEKHEYNKTRSYKHGGKVC